MTETPPSAPKHGHGQHSGTIPAEEFHRVQDSQEFADLKKTFRSFAFPMAAAFMVWYVFYVLMSTLATGFMSQKVVGNLNWGLILGLLQFVSTYLITWLYIRHMNRKVDPIATKLREELERSAR